MKGSRDDSTRCANSHDGVAHFFAGNSEAQLRGRQDNERSEASAPQVRHLPAEPRRRRFRAGPCRTCRCVSTFS